MTMSSPALKDALALLIEKSRQSREKQQAEREQFRELAETIGLDDERRCDNLRLLRAFMNGRQEDFFPLVNAGSQSTYSKMERGEHRFSADTARKVEAELNLSRGWLDRNNGTGLFLSNEEFELVLLLRDSPTEVTKLLLETVRILRSGKSV